MRRAHTFEGGLQGVDGRTVEVQWAEVVAGLDAGVGAHQVEEGGAECTTRTSRATRCCSPRAKTSRPSRSRAISRAAASRIASSRRSWKARCSARSSPEGSGLGRVGRQQQAGLQEREPGCHDQVVGGELDAKPPGGVNEGQVLLGELQDRDAAQVDLLGAGERQQQVERTLEAVDVDHQRLGGSRSAASKKSSGTSGAERGELGFERRRIGSGGGAAASERGFGAREAAPASARGRLGHGGHLGGVAVAVQHHVAAGRERALRARSPTPPFRACIEMSSVSRRP